MNFYDRFLLWISGKPTLVLIEGTNVVVILNRSGERYEWQCERIAPTSLRCQIVDLKRIDVATNEMKSAFVVFPENLVNLVESELTKKGMSINIE